MSHTGYRTMKKLQTSFNRNTQVFVDLPHPSLVLDFYRRVLPPLLLLLLLLVGFSMVTICWLFGQKCIRRTQELSHLCWQGEVFEGGHGRDAGYFSDELQELLVQSGQADQDTAENHPDEARGRQIEV